MNEAMIFSLGAVGTTGFDLASDDDWRPLPPTITGRERLNR
jgi:hypothetical protein